MSRRLAVWLVILIVLVALVVQAAATRPTVSAITTPLQRNGVTYTGTRVQSGGSDVRIATIRIAGVVTDGSSSADGSTTGSEDIVRMFDAIAADKDTWDGVVLELDTPGGSVTAAEEIHAAIVRFKAKSKLPVLAWMRGTAASAGYYAAAPTDRIVASANTFTGSIGVILEYYVVEELADRIGVDSVVIKSRELKDMGNPFRAATTQERELFQSIIDQAYDQFVEVVADGRDMTDGEVRKIADGRIYTGAQAKDVGLVDELGLRSTAYDAMAKLVDRKGVTGEDLDVVAFRREFSLLSSLFAGARPSIDSIDAAADAARAVSGDPDAIRRLAAGSDQPAPRGLARLEYRAVIE